MFLFSITESGSIEKSRHETNRETSNPSHLSPLRRFRIYLRTRIVIQIPKAFRHLTPDLEDSGVIELDNDPAMLPILPLNGIPAAHYSPCLTFNTEDGSNPCASL